MDRFGSFIFLGYVKVPWIRLNRTLFPGPPDTPRPELPSKARLSKSMPGFLSRGSSILCSIHVKNSLKLSLKCLNLIILIVPTIVCWIAGESLYHCFYCSARHFWSFWVIILRPTGSQRYSLDLHLAFRMANFGLTGR